MRKDDDPALSRQRIGHLVIIGGGEDREKDKEILSHFVGLAGGKRAKLIVMTAASTQHRQMWEIYNKAFAALGVSDRVHLALRSREEAADPECAKKIASADGVFMTGGDQKRLLAMIGGTLVDSAMHKVFK